MNEISLLYKLLLVIIILVKLENITAKCVILANKDEFIISICNEENHD